MVSQAVQARRDEQTGTTEEQCTDVPCCCSRSRWRKGRERLRWSTKGEEWREKEERRVRVAERLDRRVLRLPHYLVRSATRKERERTAHVDGNARDASFTPSRNAKSAEVKVGA
jgi:hypothetical protein